MQAWEGVPQVGRPTARWLSPLSAGLDLPSAGHPGPRGRVTRFNPWNAHSRSPGSRPCSRPGGSGSLWPGAVNLLPTPLLEDFCQRRHGFLRRTRPRAGSQPSSRRLKAEKTLWLPRVRWTAACSHAAGCPGLWTARLKCRVRARPAPQLCTLGPLGRRGGS